MSCTIFIVLLCCAKVTNSEKKISKHFDQRGFKTQLNQVTEKPYDAYKDLLNESENQLNEFSDGFKEPRNEMYEVSNGFKEAKHQVNESPYGFVGGKVGCRWVHKCVKTRGVPMCWWEKKCRQMG